jgi:Ca2+-binding RTX toxin-like protein
MPINVTGSVRYGTTGIDNFGPGLGNDVYYMTADGYVTDSINGGAGADTVDYSAAHVAVKITLTDAPMKGGLSSGGTVEADFTTTSHNYVTGTSTTFTHHQVLANLTSIENATGSDFNDLLTGNSANNILKGGAGNDVIDGRGGNDTIYSGLGADSLTGGNGQDTFVFTDYRDSGTTFIPLSGGGFNAVNHGIDTIQDFVTGVDKIDLSQIDADTTHSGNQAFHIVDQLTGHAGELRVVLGTDVDTQNPVNEGFFMLEGDVNGDGIGDFQLFALVNDIGVVNLATDFLL